MDWQNFTVSSTAPVLLSEIEDVAWVEDTTDNSIDLDDYYYDVDGDTLTYTYDVLPKGTLLYESFDNLSDSDGLKNLTYEDVGEENGLTNNALLIQSEVNNLLINGDFEDNTYDVEYVEIPNEWVRHSYPTYAHNSPPTESYVEVNKHDYYSQAVNVTAGENYIYSLYMINASSPGYGRMHINWFNSQYPDDDTANKTDSYLSSTLDCDDPYDCDGIINLSTTELLNNSGARQTMELVAPSSAAYAEIVLDTDVSNVIARIDKVQFEAKDYASVFYDGQRDPGQFYYPASATGSRENLELNDGTITMFVKPTWDANQTNVETETFFNVQTSGVDVFLLQAYSETLTFSVMGNSLTHDISDWDADEWHFLAASWDSNGLLLRDDAVTESLVSSISFESTDISAANIFVGQDANGGNQANAYIEEFAIFDYEKSTSELNDISSYENSSYIEEPIGVSIASGVVTLTPQTDFFGEQRILFYGADAYTTIQSNMVSLNVTSVDDAPRFNLSNSLDNQSWWMNRNQTLDLSSTLYDVDSDTLTYTLDFTSGSGNISIASLEHNVTLIPDVDWSGSQQARINVTDGSSMNSTNLFNMTLYFNLINESWVEGVYYTNNHSSVLTEIYASSVYNGSNITDITGHLIVDSNIYNSNISNSNVTNCNITNSTLIDINIEDAVVVGAYIDPSNITNSTITGRTRIIDSYVLNSIIQDSNITNSNIFNWDVRNANITNDMLCWGLIYDGDGSPLLRNKTANGTCENLPYLINYDPLITDFTLSVDDETVVAQFNVNDLNFEASGDTVTYTLDWGDGTTETGSVNNSNQVTETTDYSSSGTYTVSLSIEDSDDGSDSTSGSVVVTVDSGSSSPSPSGNAGGGGGSGGGRTIVEEEEEEQEDYVGQATGTIASCIDGIKNQGEEGVDCGGPCPPCLVSATCYDNIRNQGEEEVDCGGPCPSCSIEEDSGLGYMVYVIIIFLLAIVIFAFATNKPKFKPKKLEEGLKQVARPIRMPVRQMPIIRHEAVHPKQTGDVFSALRKYINARLRQGVHKDHIKETLMVKGWPEEVIDVALDGSTELEDRLNEVENYIRNSFASGYKLKQIKSALIRRGWTEGITDLLLFEVHRPSHNIKNLREYMDYKIMQGKNLSEIKQILRSVGWREGVIDSLLR